MKSGTSNARTIRDEQHDTHYKLSLCQSRGGKRGSKRGMKENKTLTYGRFSCLRWNGKGYTLVYFMAVRRRIVYGSDVCILEAKEKSGRKQFDNCK